MPGGLLSVVMETAENPLRALAEELEGREWKVRLDGETLHVVNPAAPRLNDEIAFRDGAYRWAWGQDIGPAEDVSRVADRITHVLREVRS